MKSATHRLRRLGPTGLLGMTAALGLGVSARAGCDDAFVVEKDPFPAFAQLPKAELYPKGAAFTVGKDGSILVNGKPRYLTATLFYEGTDREGDVWTIGYKPELAWLYQNLPDYEEAQRLGFDALGCFTTLDWMKKYRDGFHGWGVNKDRLSRVFTSGFPMYVDYTASEWSHGSMFPGDTRWPQADPGEGKRDRAFKTVLHKPDSADPIPIEAWTHGKHHWVPYSMVHPDGRAIWYTCWKEGARSVLELGAKPWCYELLNEPAYWEDNAMTRRHFEARMKKAGLWQKVKDDPMANAVEFIKFMEDAFAETLAGGVKAIKEVDKNPEARFCFQPVTIRKQGIDLWKANKALNAICAHTGARGVAECAILRGLADGKPIVDSEMYVGDTTNSIRSTYLQQMMRGLNISYLFKWSRRPGDFAVNKKVKDANGRDKWVPDVEASLKRAKGVSGYNVLDPYKVPTDQLLGIRMAKRDSLDVQEFFAPRNRGVERPVAILFSSPTERLAYAAGHANFKFFDAAVTGVEFSHVPEDVLFEEDLDKKLARYKVLVLAGTDAVYDTTPAKLEKFAKDGGTIVFYGHAMELTEYEKPANRAFPGLVPSARKVTSDLDKFTFEGRSFPMTAYVESVTADAGWTTLATIDNGRPALLAKKCGRGTLYFLGGKMPADAIGAFVATVVKKHYGIDPVCSVKDVDRDDECEGMEVVKASRGAMEAYMLLSHTVRDAVRFFPSGRAAAADMRCVRIKNHPDRADREILERGKDGSYIIQLKDDGPAILVFGTADALRRRYGRTSDDVRFFTTRWADGKKEAERRFAERAKKKTAAKTFFSVDESRVKFIDLGPFANRRFVDKVAGDGKDGWTDQGVAYSLTDTPWGVANCNGVPMNFIRYDQNDDKDCLVMGSAKRIRNVPDKVTGIPVETKAGALYFLHAIGWALDGWNRESFKYVVHYGDGTTLDVPVITGRNVSDWYFVTDTDRQREHACIRGWTNSQNRGLFVWRWQNPHPEKYIVSLDVVLANPRQIPLIAAITAELPEARRIAVPLTAKGARAFSGKKGVTCTLTNGVWSIALDETAQDWASGIAEFPAIAVASNAFDRITFKMNKAPDMWGKYFENPTPKIALICRDKDNHWFYTNYVTPKYKNGTPAYRADDDPESWQDVYIPMDQIDWRRAKVIYGFLLQYEVMPAAERSGLQFKDIGFTLKN